MRKVSIGDIGDVVTGKTPRTEIKDNFGNDFLFITPNDLANGFPIRVTERCLSNKGLEEVSNNSIDGISVVVDCIGSDLGNVALVDTKCVTNQQINAVTNFKEQVNPYYVYFWFKNKKAYLQKIAGGTSVPIVNKTLFSNIKIKLPEKTIQDEIANKLLSFENKISLNNQLIDYLEEYAQLLFHKWFVDFNFPDEEGKPYKDNGGEMYEVDGKKVDGKMIPVGWSRIKLGEIVSLKNGLNYNANREEEPNAKIISVKHLNNNFILNDYVADDFYLEEQADDDFLIRRYDTIIARSASPGESAISLSDLDVYYSGFSIRMRPISEEYRYYVFFNSIRLKKMITSNADGTIIKNITQQSLNNFKSVISDKIVLEQFNKVIEPILLKIELLQQENQLLEETRDLLIKKLIK